MPKRPLRVSTRKGFPSLRSVTRLDLLGVEVTDPAMMQGRKGETTVTIFLTKTQQWTRGAQVLKYLGKSMPNTPRESIDKLAIAQLNAERSTYPWEYPWSEVIRSCRARSDNKKAPK